MRLQPIGWRYNEYKRLPWTIVVRHHDEDGGYWSARVTEPESVSV